MKILVTGVAGFIGFHVARALLARGDSVLGVDNLNDYYDVRLKRDRLATLAATGVSKLEVVELDIADAAALRTLLAKSEIEAVVHLAAQAGVRYSLENPHAYTHSNVNGFLAVLEACRQHPVEHLVYASSSSVYGLNAHMPFSVHDNVDHPVSLYAATKKANELMAHSYSHLYGMPTTGLRFFTVYGPWGRPDMAYFLFTRAILEGRPIKVFNGGEMARDFTYIDDIVEGVVRVLDRPAVSDPAWSPTAPDPGSSCAPYRVFNIGNNQPVRLLEFITTIEAVLGREAVKDFQPMQPGDVTATCADIDALGAWTGYRPATPLAEGMARFVAWYRDYYEQREENSRK
ncbi:NAD-dependent epimerase [Pseudohaliea rubra]|uniref:NAD-dependent epimerase/dehydratase n=1 Tax=Pseudohaliea rubra DSM 19751 TaxID=1265313 RepID=A0A095WYG6_9GAMM|nr:NAD-dependent epimerase [Pseudohaliea rubra]KGE03659.1 NAD-dependent epimerase/dehydratase [Pseudohaliea rubra DSM 19751]